MIERRVLQRGFLWGWFLAAALSSIVPAAELPALDKEAAAKTSFRRDVWPIVKRHCWGCHSGAEPKGGLNMSTVQDMLKGGDSGTALTAGKPDDSLLIESITGEEPEMPKDKPPLSVAKIQILRHWILAGAKDDSPPGANQAQVNIPEVYKHAPSVTSVSFSPDGKLLAAACRSEVVLVEVTGNAAPRRLPTESGLINHVEFSPDGKILAAAGGSPVRFGEVRFFNVADGQLHSARRIGHDTLFRGSFSPDGKTIALGGTDGAIHLIPVDPNAEVRSYELHSDWVFDVAFAPSGKLLVSGGRDKAVKVSSAQTGELIHTVDQSPELISAVASNNEFAIGAGRARTVSGYEYKIALTPTELNGQGGNATRPVDKRGQYLKAFEGQSGEVLDIATSGDRKLLATAGTGSDVRVYNIADRQRIALISGVPAPVYAVALNADGSRLAIGTASGQLQLYELPAGKLLKSLVPVPVEVAAK